jgi:hypothetical protein
MKLTRKKCYFQSLESQYRQIVKLKGSKMQFRLLFLNCEFEHSNSLEFKYSCYVPRTGQLAKSCCL